MMYVARARPEAEERKGIEKTRGLDQFLWACLKPKGVQSGSGSPGTNGNAGDKAPLLGRDGDSPSSNASRDGAAKGVARVVREAVKKAFDRQHQHFLQELGDKRSNSIHTKYFNSYMKYRTAESDWELARHCYGQIVGEDVDLNGEPVLVIDNPSATLLELVVEAPTSGADTFSGRKDMGFYAAEEGQESCLCTSRTVNRVSFKEKPSIEFFFTAIDGNTQPPNGNEFEKALRQQLQGLAKEDMSQLEINVDHSNVDLHVKVSGPGSLISRMKDRGVSSLKVMKYQGRPVDNHSTLIVKKQLMMPYAGARGKGGALNFAVDLLRFRDGYIGSGYAGDATPWRMLFGIFDARHQPHPDFWSMCIPKFMTNKDVGYNYEVNNEVVLVQAPQSFPAIKDDVDVLDINNGMAFNLMNVVRNRCGGVTSCGTNAVWQINNKEFPDQEIDSMAGFFDSRTKVEDTATTHMHFCKGKRSVYVHETVSTGIAKLNANYLGAIQRWAEGAVQLFWIELFVDRSYQLVLFVLGIFVLVGSTYFSLYGPSTKDMYGSNFFCDVKGEATLLLGQNHAFCDPIYELFSNFLYKPNDRIIFKMAAADYMAMIDASISWLCVCICTFCVVVVLAWTGFMPKIVRASIMIDNISYFWTSLCIPFWLALMLFMIIGMDPPLMFNVTHFMFFVLAINLTQHGMIYSYKSLGEYTELSVWRAQQSYAIAAPLFIGSIFTGTMNAWGIATRQVDMSYWKTTDKGDEVVRNVTIWVTAIWIMFVVGLLWTIFKYIHGMVTGLETKALVQQCQIGALMMLGLLSIMVWEALLSVWDLGRTVETMSKDGKGKLSHFASFVIWWRTKAWVVRYIIDFGLPLVVLVGMTGGISLLTLAAYATIVQGFRA